MGRWVHLISILPMAVDAQALSLHLLNHYVKVKRNLLEMKGR